MKTTLTKAFQEFLDDLANVAPIDTKLRQMTHDEIVVIVREEIEEKKANDIKLLNLGKIYMSSNSKTKRAILNHLNNLKFLTEEIAEEIIDEIATSSSTPDDLATLLPQVLNHDNLQRMADVVSRHKGNSENVVDILKNVVNSEEFEVIAKDLTKNLKRN